MFVPPPLLSGSSVKANRFLFSKRTSFSFHAFLFLFAPLNIFYFRVNINSKLTALALLKVYQDKNCIILNKLQLTSVIYLFMCCSLFILLHLLVGFNVSQKNIELCNQRNEFEKEKHQQENKKKKVIPFSHYCCTRSCI